MAKRQQLAHEHAYDCTRSDHERTPFGIWFRVGFGRVRQQRLNVDAGELPLFERISGKDVAARANQQLRSQHAHSPQIGDGRDRGANQILHQRQALRLSDGFRFGLRFLVDLRWANSNCRRGDSSRHDWVTQRL